MLESQKNVNSWRRYVFLAFVGVLALGTVFGAGFFAGRWSARNQLAPLTQRFIFPTGHGAVGKITQIEGATITLQTRNGARQTILTDSQTRFDRGGTKITKLSLRDLKVGDQIIVTGTPNAQGQIKAKSIRVLAVPALTPTPSGL
ncbi:MAG: DUF5666 domain-containing protein [Chloroflexota bacterium]